MRCQNFAYIFEKKAYLHPDDTAVVEWHRPYTYTYRDLHKRANRLANALLKSGIKKGDRICCITANTVEYIDLFTAAARIGAMLCPINYRLSVSEVIKIISDAGPRILICDAEFIETAQAIGGEKTSIEKIVCYGTPETVSFQGLDDFLEDSPESAPEISGDSEDVLLLLYTAGSTGKPKGVPLKQTNLFFNAMNWIIDLGITRADYTLTVIPLFHIGGHMLWTLPHLVVGAKVLLQRRPSPGETLEILAKQDITNTYFIPAMGKMILSHPGFKNSSFSTVRFIGAGGEAVPEAITNAFGKLNIPILNSYGLTETADGTIGIRPYEAKRVASNCIGKPLTFTEAKIVDENGRDVDCEEEGELLHRGPSVVDGYFKSPEETKKAFRDGWLYTGDRAKKDENGFFYFLGRRDDMIVSGGENIYPTEVEEKILGYEKVSDAAVLGVPDEQWGETIKAIVAVKDPDNWSEDDFLSYLKTKMSRFKVPRIIEVVDELPKIGSGKLDRALIKKNHGKRS
ncbi:MAG: acyl--CoA ligase [Desulfobacterales bacterium]|nr:acyl--CoA ligase [Desulfobacterales bacterium]